MPPTTTIVPPATFFKAVGTWKDEWHGVNVVRGIVGQKVRYFDTTGRASFLDARHHIFKNPRRMYKDIVYILINMSWTSFTVWILGFSAFITLVFALVFHYVCLDTDVFEDAFNLSYQSFSTIGFGILYPRNICGNLSLSLEAFFSMIIISAFSGLVFVRFSKPRSSAVFSRQCVVQPYGRHLALVIRVANATRCRDLHEDSILEASFRVNLLRIEERSDTDATLVLRRYDLPMLQAEFLAIRQDIQLVHVINEFSPFYGLTKQTIAASDFAIQVDLLGVDATTQNTVQCQMLYSALQVEWGAKFMAMYPPRGTDDRENTHDRRDLHLQPGIPQLIMDFDLLSATVPAPIPSTSPRTSIPFHAALSPPASGLPPLLPPISTRQLAYAKSRQYSIKDVVAQSMAGGGSDSTDVFSTVESPCRESFHSIDMSPLGSGRHSRHRIGHLSLSLLSNEVSNMPHRTSLDSIATVENTPDFGEIIPRNAPLPFSFHTVYTEALKTSWPLIIGYSFVAFVVLNLLFAVVYYFDMDGVSVYEDIRGNNTDFGVCLFYSVHTLSTVGYGAIGPKAASTYQNFWVMVESTLGIVVITIFTGISWSKFSRPRAHIVFSDKVVVTRIRGDQRVLLVRVLNLRTHGNISGNVFRLGVTEVNKRTNLRQVHDVELVNVTYPSINVPATLVHVITDKSPLAKFKSIDDFLECNLQLLCLYSGIDHTFSSNVYARKMYTSKDFVVDEQFADCADFTPEGGMAVHYEQFHTHQAAALWHD